MPPEPVRRLSVEQYHAMIETGILGEEDRIELLEGWLIEKMTKNTHHIAAARRVRRRLERVATDGWMIEVQDPVTTADSEPEPDVMVVSGTEEDFDDERVQASDVGLVVEVSDASLARDRGQKQRIYAAARIPVYWIINVIDRQVEVFTNPSGEGDLAAYETSSILTPGSEVPVVLDGREIGRIAVVELLP
jgi:Uma2 family endonuclease